MRRPRSKRGDANALHGEILRRAAPFVKVHGLTAPVDDIMKAAGLTSGALYSHFKNKDDLCNQVITYALDDGIAWFRSMLTERGLKVFIEAYLSVGHVGSIAEGCPFSALAADMAKANTATRRLYEARVQTLIATIASELAGRANDRRRTAQRVIAAMLGAVMLARSMVEPALVADLLSQVRASVLHELA